MSSTTHCVPKVTIDAVEACLAQTQCRECGYLGCRPYAEAMVRDGAEINKCRPGGEAVVAELAAVLGRPGMAPAQPPLPQVVAVVAVAQCIGCTKCLQICPTDAIMGAPKMQHAVVVADCTGCRLCGPVCPVDCIAFEEGAALSAKADIARLIQAKKERENNRLERELSALHEELAVTAPAPSMDAELAAKIAAAREKSKEKYARKGTVVPKALRQKGRDA